MGNRPLLVSVIVCTYNRAQLLKNCLQSLYKQSIDNKHYEVIVVDNNSIDDTEKVVNRFSRDYSSVRFVTEKNQGLSYARNRGWKEARGTYVAYIDDDAIANPDWIGQIVQFIKSHPEVNVFGGPYDRFFHNPFPDWLPENYGTLNLGNKIKLLNQKNEWLSGSNIVFNKSILEKYGGFVTNLGMKGDKILYGEETELLVRLKKVGESIYYVPTISVKHLVADYKLRFWWLVNNNYYRNFSISLMNKDRLDLLRGLFYFVKSLFLFPFCLLRVTNDPWKRKVYFGLSNIFASLGRIFGSFTYAHY